MISQWRKMLIWTSLLLLLASYSHGQRSGRDEARVVCYYANWNDMRNESFRLLPWNIDASLCTHVVYAFAMPDLTEGIVPLDFLDDMNNGQSNEFVRLKEKRPDLKLMLSVGGWDDGSRTFSQIVSEPNSARWIIEMLCQQVRKIGFDGLDLDWQWPVPGLREGSNVNDKSNYAKFISDMRKYFIYEGRKTNRTPLLLSVVLPPFKSFVELGFNLTTIIKSVDFVNLYTLGYHLPTAATVNHLAPLYNPRPSLQSNDRSTKTVDETVNMYLEKGVPASMMNLGLPFFGYAFQLKDPSLRDLGSPVDLEGPPGFGTNTNGQLSYFEICSYIKALKLSVNYPNRTAVGPYIFHDRKWCAYDDVDMIRRKVRYAVDKGLGGLCLWTIDMDDFNGICSPRFPLTRAASEFIRLKEESRNDIVRTTDRSSLNNGFPQENGPFLIGPKDLPTSNQPQTPPSTNNDLTFNRRPYTGIVIQIPVYLLVQNSSSNETTIKII